MMKMCDNEVISHQISLFCSLIQSRRFDDGTLRILETILITRDVNSLLDLQRSLNEFMRHESVCVLRETNQMSVHQKLLIVEFFVRAFAITGDLESCLALRYEAFVLREMNCGVDQMLCVLYSEWFAFAEQAVDNRFFAIARKACDKALVCFQANDMLKTKDADALCEHMETIRKVKRLKDVATVRGSSQSVQAQTVEYLKRKITENDKVSTLVVKEKQHSASFLFRNGIKKHNARKLKELQRL